MHYNKFFMDTIKILDINQNYFKHVNFEVEKNKFIVITGPSGSGKSTLVMDIIYAEGQRKFFASLPAYARKFIDLPDEPNVGEVSGLTPCIVIDQKASINNVRSTVGTMSEVYDYIRLLFAEIGQYCCLKCNEIASKKSIYDIGQEIYNLFKGHELIIEMDISSMYSQKIKLFFEKGFHLFRIEKDYYSIKKSTDIDKLANKMRLGKDINIIPQVVLYKDMLDDGDFEDLLNILYFYFEVSLKLVIQHQGITHIYSNSYFCNNCNYCFDYPKIKSQLFSFNLPTGACPTCQGLGRRLHMRGSADDAVINDRFEKILDNEYLCEICQGSRLRKEAMAVCIEKKNIHDLSLLTIIKLQNFLVGFQRHNKKKKKVVDKIIKETMRRLHLLESLGIGYLSLSRPSLTLSGGEIQRIRLAAQLGGGLSGVTYILDEPSIGLHQSDNGKLIDAICQLRDLGNTVLVVEHDEETMRAADVVVDIGPGAGSFGGKIVFNGTPKKFLKEQDSITAQYLQGTLNLNRTTKIKDPLSWFVMPHLQKNNLKDLTAKIPIDNGLMVVFSGISGSGKSTLLFDEFVPRFLTCLNNNIVDRLLNIDGQEENRKYYLEGEKHWDYGDVLLIDQKSIGFSIRSTVGTYIGFFDDIRILYADLPASKARGFTKGDFSFNSGRYRCEVCKGYGETKEILYPLPDVTLPCDKCSGKRFRHNILSITYNEKNIFDVLMMSVADAMEFFKHFKKIYKKLEILSSLGLSYMNLNQTIDTFSGGEKQRLKLALSLMGRQKKMLYVFDEPTTGLHFQDIALLLKIFDMLLAAGNTLFIIEHNIHVIKYADYIIDMGPGGGELGGEIVAVGSPAEVKVNSKSVTSKYLI